MIIGNKVILRPVQKEDTQEFNKWRNNLDIKANALMHPFPVIFEQEIDWFQNLCADKMNRTIFFTICDLNQKVIGYTQLNNINWINKTCYFGIVIGSVDSKNKGYGKETLTLITDYAFNTLNLNKILLEVIDSNAIAIKLYETCGFVMEGVLKNQIFQYNKYYDVRIYSKFK
ncbi:MAG: UDP-4-amino-4,6-dideoxy-N-acetyl-beta-L-altrosamine N-acetyltransferase [Bacteroidetes bacterium GWA2_31_9]|nr:MAG: UDP-4-amino-4,6-dideoxy-N-acetyl-beta-L-altrosamine N-acetyltransferase [Bacteroidetes bacterium GWA2_31_9]